MLADHIAELPWRGRRYWEEMMATPRQKEQSAKVKRKRAKKREKANEPGASRPAIENVSPPDPGPTSPS